ncbi:MAG: hypothetical protein FJ147_10235 [Deltaproteobacteria bacterium]|nr:hypothetical protein [Deltaproteobacteria bacterium]
MPRRAIERIRDAIRTAAYDMTSHAVEEMAEDSLDFADIETAIGRFTGTGRYLIITVYEVTEPEL